MQNSKEHLVPMLTGGAIGESLKARLQGLLRWLGIYHRLKSSFLYELYWRMADRRLIENRRREFEFYKGILGDLKNGDLIFDVGANIGQKTNIFLRLGAKVVAVEPDPLNQEVLRQSFLDYRFVKKPVVIVGKAISAESGSQIMWVDEPGSAINTLSPKWVATLRTDVARFGKTLDFRQMREVETITLEELIGSYGLPLYVKIDVEGHEASVLSGLRTAVRFVSFEVNLPQFKPEALECIQYLECVATGGDFNYAPDCLRGFAFESWVPKQKFVDALNSCRESCIEVFWRAPIAQSRGS